jgi:hypothetical protein
MIQPLLMLAAAAFVAGGERPAASAPAVAQVELAALTGRAVDNANRSSAGREALLTKALAETERATSFRKGNMESGILMGSAGIIREIGAPGAKR